MSMSYFSRFHGVPQSAIRSLGHFKVSGLGFGTHHTHTLEHARALRFALENGCNLIDTSPSYMNGEAEKMVGGVLGRMMKETDLEREEVCVVTKLGSLSYPMLQSLQERNSSFKYSSSPPFAFPPSPSRITMITDREAYSHSKDFIAHSVTQSIENLQTQPDIVLLHNPEWLLAHTLNQPGKESLTEEEEEAFYSSLSDAFSVLESILPPTSLYGLSTNPIGCRYSVSGGDKVLAESINLKKVQQAAQQAAGNNHRCKIIQTPMNLLETNIVDPIYGEGGERWGGKRGGERGGERGMTVVEMAKELGFFVMGNRPLNAIPPKGVNVVDWEGRKTHLRLKDTIPAEPVPSLIKEHVKNILKKELGESGGVQDMDLDQLALLFSLSAPSIDVTLSGMRHGYYVQRGLGILAGEMLERKVHDKVVEGLRELVDELDHVGSSSSDPSSTTPTSSSPSASSSSSSSSSSSASPPPPQTKPGKYVDMDVTKGTARIKMEPEYDGGVIRAVGASDRGIGLVYRLGSKRNSLEGVGKEEGERGVGGRGEEGNLWVVKVQGPLDVSSDAADGIGIMTKATLLIHDEGADFVHYYQEEDKGHTDLLRCALSQRKEQVAFLWAENISREEEVVVEDRRKNRGRFKRLRGVIEDKESKETKIITKKYVRIYLEDPPQGEFVW